MSLQQQQTNYNYQINSAKELKYTKETVSNQELHTKITYAIDISITHTLERRKICYHRYVVSIPNVFCCIHEIASTQALSVQISTQQTVTINNEAKSLAKTILCPTLLELTGCSPLPQSLIGFFELLQFHCLTEVKG